MSFDDILTQIIDLLKRQGRVSYSALKRRFDLDEDYLNDLKDELLFAHPVVDEGGRGLVWTGNSAGTAETVSPSDKTVPKPLPPQETPVVQPPSPVASSAVPEAERRQLTVMFCDLVDSTQLSSQLDPEDLRDVVRAYQRVCSEVITHFEGHIAQLLGDGLLVYFGYPQAHEDDAQRAVRTGLGILDALEDLHQGLHQTPGIQLGIRIGIHTGLVVIGEMGGAGRQEQLALGEVPNLAARLQGLATPNTLVISEATSRLVQGYFTCETLGEQTLRGVAQSLQVYRVLSESSTQSRLDIARTHGLTPLVGREQEVGLLLERWAQATSGQGQVVLLTGDAGIGKSRLVQMLKDHVANESHIRWECRSSPYFENTALFPLIDLLQRLWRFQTEDTPDEKLGKLEAALSQYRLPLEESVPLFAPLLSRPVPENYPSLNLSPQRQRQKTLETIVAILQEHAEHQPVLFIVEDLHWTDPTTLELLNLVIEQTPTASILVLLTCRPQFQPGWHHRSYLTEITVNRLSPTQIEQIVNRMTEGRTFPSEVLAQIVGKTDGVPLFVEEITKSLLESGQLKAVDRHYALTGSLSSLAIPATLQDSLMARLDRLMTGKVIAQLGATIGRQFSYPLLQHVSQLDASTLQRELGRLVEAEMVYQRGLPPQATYVFKHALIQDAAYQSLLKSTRQQYHQRITQVLEEHFPETVEGQPELLAHHYMEAAVPEQAIAYWHKAGQQAGARSGHMEAIAHLRQGLALLETLPETPQRLQRHVTMLIALGASLRATQGTSALEVGATYTRARQLCQHLDNPHQLFPVLRGLHAYYNSGGALQTSHELGEQLLTLAQHVQDPLMLPAAHRALGTSLFYLGMVAAAHTHFVQGITLYDPKEHRAAAFLYGEDVGVYCRSQDSWTLWSLGYPHQGLTWSQEAVTLAQQVAHPLSLSFALSCAAMLHQFRREVGCTQTRADAAIRLAKEQGFPYWVAFSTLPRAWALAQQGQVQAGIAQMLQGVMAWHGTGAEVWRPYWQMLLAEAQGMLGQPAAGLRALAEALAVADKTGERWCEAELYRLKGVLLLQQSSENHLEAEACFHQGIAIAQSQQAKSFELRTATSLARLWQQQGKRQDAYNLLAPVYGWFTEGFDTADLKEAKALLEELA